MRKDPPFDMEFVYATYILERAEAAGVLVVNRPQSLRDANEKMFTAWFPQCCPPTLVTREHARMNAFLDEHGDIIVKPLDGMGGMSIFRVRAGDPNVNVIFETLTHRQTRFAMCQRYIPAIREGDKRVLLIDGEPDRPRPGAGAGGRRRARQPRGRRRGRGHRRSRLECGRSRTRWGRCCARRGSSSSDSTSSATGSPRSTSPVRRAFARSMPRSGWTSRANLMDAIEARLAAR